jgi:glutamate-5-semialdehyde dehydrogenase
LSIDDEMRVFGEAASAAARGLACLSSTEKNELLRAMAAGLDAARGEILRANARDMEAGRAAALSAALLDRLRLCDTRVDGMIQAIFEVVALPDPVGDLLSEHRLDNGLVIRKQRVPIGVIGIVYESRPNVTADAAALCLKTGNAVILRGGKEAIHSNRAIHAALVGAGERAGLPPGSLQLVATTDRDAVRALVQLEDHLHLVIPRGGEGLIRAIMAMARVPVIKHAKGLCHSYVDRSADLDMALAICENAKCQRPGVCNAMETLLVHSGVAERFLTRVSARLRGRGVELRGDAEARRVVPFMLKASEEDWRTEYLELTLSVRVVPSLEAAIEHIARYGSGRSEAIIAEDPEAQAAFVQQVDAAAVYVNASTRFTDGGQFGMGAEIGISTDRLHARGPMGLEELTTYKYVALGAGQVRS